MPYQNKSFFFCLAILLLGACDEPDQQNQIPDPSVHYDVIVLNEGNFRTANASVDFYASSSNERVAKVFQNANSSRPLGDVAQSMISYQNKYFVVVNNSAKIEVLDPNTFQSIGQISNLNSPRYILPTQNDLAYVSDLYQEKLYKVNLATYDIVAQLDYPGWIEEMVKVNDYAFLCNRDSSQVLVIDIHTDTLVKKINVSANPNSLVVDKNGHVWVSCSGSNASFAALTQIDSDALEIIKSLSSNDLTESFGELEINATKDKLYYLNDGVYECSISDSVLSSSPFIPLNDRLFYALGIHPSSQEIYVSDAIDYVQSGIVFRYSESGQELANFRTGIIPGFLFFR